MLRQVETGSVRVGDVVHDVSNTGRDAPNSLELAILCAVAYRDLFDYPVSVDELHRYLHGIRCAASRVAGELERSAYLHDKLVTDGEYFALAGRESLFGLRRRRKAISAALWPEAVAHGERLASIPFVRMVAVTGSLAVDNADDSSDIDFMVVTQGGRMWTCRLAAKLLQLTDGLLSRKRLCVNYLVSTRALELDQPSLYVAQELTQMVPLYGTDVYDSLRASNSWTDDYLPNANGVPTTAYRAECRYSKSKRVCEFLLRSPPGGLLERWERERKLCKYNETAFLLGRSTPFTAEATGHRRNVKRLIEDAFADRLNAVLDPSPRLSILVGQAYHLCLDPKLWRAMQPFPPLGSLYAAAVARGLGHDVRVHDSMLSVTPGEWTATLQVLRPDVVVLYEDNFNYLTKMCLSTMRDRALEMIAAAKEAGARTLVCSSDSADEPERYLRAGADFVLVGEGEATLAEVLQLITNESAKVSAEIPGIAYLDEAGAVVRTPPRAVIRHVDDLPMPAWDLIDIGRYTEIWSRAHQRKSLNMVTTRGCPYHCNWCAKPIWGQRYNARSPENVVAEIARLRQYADVDYIWFMDDIFGLKPGWIARFADTLEAEGVSIRFKALSRPDILLRPGEVEALARAGCDVIWMGAESGSQKILDAMEKGTMVENIHDASAALRANGIRTGLFIQFGYPGETRRDIRATIDMIRRIMPDELGISVSYPLPGTPFYERVREQLGATRHWRDSDDLAMLFKGPYRTGFYRALHRYVHADLAMRRAWRDLTSAERRGRLGWYRQWRKAGLIGYSALRVARYTMAMAVLSRLPHASVEQLPVELDNEAAARPSPQPGD